MEPINESAGEHLPYLAKIAAEQRISLARVSVLYELAVGTTAGDSFAAVRAVAACLRHRDSPADELAPVQQQLAAAPWMTTSSRGDGSEIYLNLPVNHRTKMRTDHLGAFDLQVWKWGDVTADTPVRAGHDGPIVGRVVATQRKSYGDLEVWAKLDDKATIERAAYRELEASPTIRAGSRGTWSHNPTMDTRTQEVWLADVDELALVPSGSSALRIPVELRTAPAEQVREQTLAGYGPLYVR